jgi:hypothetical protein
MKKIKERIPFIAFVSLLVLLGTLIVIPTSVSGVDFDRCQSGTCRCFCPTGYCSCGAYDGRCWCTCQPPYESFQCPDGGSGGGELPPYWI